MLAASNAPQLHLSVTNVLILHDHVDSLNLLSSTKAINIQVRDIYKLAKLPH